MKSILVIRIDTVLGVIVVLLERQRKIDEEQAAASYPMKLSG
jgi:hypothetical protein